jgi:long-chain fatty acid transport protein
MGKRFLAGLAAVSAVLSVSSFAFAAGFRLSDQSASALGMASAVVGQADDASAVWYNPAGIAELDGTRIAGGVVGIYPSLAHEATSGSTEVSEREIHLPPHLYLTHRINEKTALGLGLNSPFGLSSHWNGDSSVRYVSTFSHVMTAEVNPNIAFRLNDDLSVAFGAAYLRLRATLENIVRVQVPNPAPPPALLDLGDRNFRLSGDGDGWGLNAALKYRISENVSVGFSYRSRIKVDVDGTAELTGAPLPFPGSGSASTSITLPDLLQAGVSYRATDSLTLNADLEYTWWSTYDRLVIASDNPAFSQTEEHRWKDVWCLRVGGQYRISERWKLRAGLVYDKNPVREEFFDTRLPDSDRAGVSAGAGYSMGRVNIDAGYMFVKFLDRTITDSLLDDLTPTPAALNGTYKSEAHQAAITVGYRF